MKRLLLSLALLVVLPAVADTFTTPKIVAATFKGAPHCLHYQVQGFCVWRHHLRVSTTLLVDEHLPDAVVMVYRQENSNPWNLIKNLLDVPAYEAGKATLRPPAGTTMDSGYESNQGPMNQNTRYKEVDVVGNPALLFWPGKPFFISSTASAFTPYYSSLLDARFWRGALLDMAMHPANLWPTTNRIGSMTNQWGPLFPRAGFVIQANDAKAAAIDASRAASIVTDHTDNHLYYPLPYGSDACGHHCNVAAADINSKDTQWQMIYPKVENQCIVFGEQRGSPMNAWEHDATSKGDGNYVWVLWRDYNGCVQGHGKLVKVVHF